MSIFESFFYRKCNTEEEISRATTQPFLRWCPPLIPVVRSPLTYLDDERTWIHHSERHQTLRTHVPTWTVSPPAMLQ